MKKSQTYVCRNNLLTERGSEPFKVVPDKFNGKHIV